MSILCVKSKDGNGAEGFDFSTTSEKLSKFKPILSRNSRTTCKGKNICLDAPSKFYKFLLSRQQDDPLNPT